MSACYSSAVNHHPGVVIDGDYRNILSLDLVYNPEWKPLHETPPDRGAHAHEQATSVQ
jgi:hypothetical protein